MNAASSCSALSRYTSPQFRHDPVGSMAKLMGLHGHLDTIRQHEEAVFPVLCGLIMYRHLDRPERMKVNRAIRDDIPRGPLTAALIGLIGEISSAPLHYQWSLSDAELREQLESSTATVEILDAIGVSTVSAPTAVGTAKAIYDVSVKGGRQYARDKASSTVRDNRAQGAARRLGLSPGVAKGLGLFSVTALAVLSFVRLNSAARQNDARRETALRNLIQLEDR